MIPRKIGLRNVPDLKVDTADGTKNQDDEVNKVKEKEPVGIPKPKNVQILPTKKYESDTDILDSNKDVEKDKKAENTETNKVEGRKNKDKADDERKTGLESLARIKPVDDVLKDNNFKDGTRASAKPKSDRNPVIENGERRRLKTQDAMVCEPCEKVLHEESSLNPHMQEASDMENDDQKGRSSDELTPNEPKRKKQ